MVYLDYAANTPVSREVMDCFLKTSMNYVGNPNARHQAGRDAERVIRQATEEILRYLGCTDMEVIYTSGASEANNLAIKGAARTYRENGKHIISTFLEHSSVSGALTWLQTMGYEIDLVHLNKDGTVDLEHFRELLRPDTVLVSIGAVDGELGVRQPIEEIAKMLEKYPDCNFHVDATQIVGKTEIRFDGVDLITFAPHKFYGLGGMGILLRRQDVVLEPLIHGGRSTSIYRSGTPVTAWATATAEALKQNYEAMEERYQRVEHVNQQIRQIVSRYPLVHINSTEKSLPHFLNLSIPGRKAEEVQEAFSNREIYLSTKAACSVPNTPSRAVMTVTGDRKIARASFRISISHLTSDEEIKEFTKAFDEIYNELASR